MEQTGHFEISEGVLVRYRGREKAVQIPSGVTAIGYKAFMENRSLEEVTIPEGVTQIGEKAFYSCERLRRVLIPEGVTSIGREAFSWCVLLEDVTLPESLRILGEGAFGSCGLLTCLRIPEGVSRIGDRAFILCRSLEKVILSRGLQRIGRSAFCSCEALTELVLPEGLEAIEDSAFLGCGKLKDIRFPEGLRRIGEKAFYECRSFRSLTLPDSLTQIGREVFSGCSALEYIRFPRGCDFTACFGFAACPAPYVAVYDPEEALLISCPVWLGGSLLDLPERARPRAFRGFVYALDHGIREIDVWREDYLAYARDHCGYFLEDAVRSRSFLLFMVREALLDSRTADALMETFTGRGDAEACAVLIQYRRDRFGEGDTGSLTL